MLFQRPTDQARRLAAVPVCWAGKPAIPEGFRLLALSHNHAIETQRLLGLFAQGLRREALPDP